MLIAGGCQVSGRLPLGEQTLAQMDSGRRQRIFRMGQELQRDARIGFSRNKLWGKQGGCLPWKLLGQDRPGQVFPPPRGEKQKVAVSLRIRLAKRLELRRSLRFRPALQG